MPDYARHLQGWTPGMPTGARGRTTTTNTRRGRPAGTRTPTQTTTRNRPNAGGRVLNAAQDMPAADFSPLIARNLANVLGTVGQSVALSGIPLDIAQQILADGYTGKS